MQETVEQLQGQNSQLQQSQSELEDEVAKLQNEVANLNQELDAEREKSTAAARDLQQTKIELFSLQQQFSSLHDQAASRSTSDATHYKERAKLQAEIAALQRANHSLLTEKTELEGSLEDLTLDKEQLTEEKETLEERLEELKIDAETAQMEVEELRVELESAKESSTSTAVSGDEEAQALATQNARLREALIRLREQTSHEKVDLWRQLKAAEKQANLSLASQSELESLRASKADLEEQVGLLKETVDQGSAFESMVEDLSDRVMALEDENVALQSTIREMEDAADIAAELEEVQAEEVKALMRDLEGRDTSKFSSTFPDYIVIFALTPPFTSVIRNLEEAIKMQRRREEDFQRTIINYRSTVETLKQEKNELLALQRGGEGEKSKIIATSQKALARAAQLVSDAAKARKRDAEYAFAQVERDVQRHLAERLESMLPPSVVSAELAAIKGELLLCKIVGKAFMTLEGLSASFSKTIRSGMAEIISAGESPVEQSGAAKMSDEAAQTIFRLLHETSFCTSTIEMSSELVRFLAAGHWPDMLNTEQSTELGSAFVHLLSELDVLMGDHLKILKEEGSLSPHRSNLGGFQQLIGATLNALKNIRSIDDKVLVANNWKPPAWQLFMDASIAKFNCLGASASIAAAANPDDGPDSATLLPSMLRRIMPKMEQISSEAIKTGPRMSNLDVGNEKLVKDLERTVASWKIESQNLVDSVRALFQDQSAIRSDKILACEAVAESAIRTLSLLTSSLRAADLNSQDPDSPHALSAECQDPWLGVSVLSQKIRAIDGDPEDVNFAVRASKIEQRLSVAIENEPKLELANNKVATLEKNLGARSKEIALQNARLSELEQLLAKSNIQASSSRMPATASLTEELFKFKEENRVLTDAMDVLQQQVDEYEAELRVLKDPRGFSSKGRSSRSTPVRSSSRRSSIGRPEEGVPDISPAALTALEAAVFRPALESLRREGSALKASTISKTLCELPPMSVPCLMVKHANSVMEPNKASHSDRNDHVTHMSSVLHAARASLRLERASVRVVDLSSSASARSKWRQSLWKASLAEERLREASIAAASLVSGHA
jgi:dynactin 1